MIGYNKYVSGFIAILLSFVLSSAALAQDFGLSPSEIEIRDLPPGQETEFNLTIYNKGERRHTFLIVTYAPDESQRRYGRAEFPDGSWLTFPRRVEVEANSNVQVKMKLTIPSDVRWADKDWEIWLGIAPESGDFLTVKLYVRLLVSTATGSFSGHQIGHAIRGISIMLVLVILGVYYLWYKKRKK